MKEVHNLKVSPNIKVRKLLHFFPLYGRRWHECYITQTSYFH